MSTTKMPTTKMSTTKMPGRLPDDESDLGRLFWLGARVAVLEMVLGRRTLRRLAVALALLLVGALIAVAVAIEFSS